MWEAYAVILLKKNGSLLPPSLGSEVLTRKVTLYNSLCYSSVIIYFLLNRLLKRKTPRGQALYLIKGEGIDYVLLSACKRRRHQPRLHSPSRKCFQLCGSGCMQGHVHSDFGLLLRSNKSLARGSEKKWPESSPKPFFLLSVPSVLFTLIPRPWLWWELDEINPHYRHSPTDSAGIARGTSVALQNANRYPVSTASSEPASPAASAVQEQNPAVAGTLATAFCCAADIFPSPPPCKFMFFSLLRVVPIVRSSNKMCHKLSSLEAWSPR